MKNHKLIITVILLITLIGGFFIGVLYSKQAAKQINIPLLNQEQQPKVLIGYVQDFRDPNVIDYSKMTHVIFSFVHPTKDGNLLFNGQKGLNNLRAMVSKGHQQDTKIMLAVGGWYHIKGGKSYPYFKEAITNPASRTKLINELVGIADRENLDGIDIDFEYPLSTEDAHNLATFTKILSDKLHERKKELSIAVNAKVHSVTGAEINSVVYEPSMFNYVDHVNVIAYDGQWDGEYNAANFAPYPHTENIVNYWSSLFNTHHLSKEKLVLGVPFYAQPENPKKQQITYSDIIKNNPENIKSDIVNMNGTTYYYNGLSTVQKKTELALSHEFGGMMIWEVGNDAKGTYSLTSIISEALNIDHSH